MGLGLRPMRRAGVSLEAAAIARGRLQPEIAGPAARAATMKIMAAVAMLAVAAVVGAGAMMAMLLRRMTHLNIRQISPIVDIAAENA